MNPLILPRPVSRRTFIKTSGLAIAASSLAAPAVHAAASTLKIGYVTPATGPLAGFAEADAFNIDILKTMTKTGLTIGGAGPIRSKFSSGTASRTPTGPRRSPRI